MTPIRELPLLERRAYYAAATKRWQAMVESDGFATKGSRS